MFISQKKITQSHYFIFVFCFFVSTCLSGYPLVHIENRTNESVIGKVSYIFCNPDFYAVQPLKDWTAESRGACLLTQISAKNNTTPEKTAYTSTGTSFSQFLVLKNNIGEFIIRAKR